MGQIRSLLGQTATYGLSSIVGRLLNYILVPIYTEVFLPAEYGIVTELYADVAFLNILYTFGIETTFFRFASKSKGKEILFYHQGLSLILIWTAILSSLLYGFSDQIASLLDYEGKGVFIEWLAFILAIDTLVAIPFARLRLKGMAIRFASYKLINILANLLLNLFFLLLLPMLAQSSPGGFYEQIYDPDLGVGYVFLSNLLSNFLFLLFFLPDMFRFRF
ncbi:MAG: oligosaccharide flippase family protein, partial [Cyclobacteriaceae bacterium]|nr:oligosaccharide flippase family protein [Cyclobacteriaceae bacterium]